MATCSTYLDDYWKIVRTSASVLGFGVFTDATYTQDSREKVSNRHKEPTLPAIEGFVDIARNVVKGDEDCLQNNKNNSDNDEAVANILFKIFPWQLGQESWV
jgi:hypothetical protein